MIEGQTNGAVVIDFLAHQRREKGAEALVRDLTAQASEQATLILSTLTRPTGPFAPRLQAAIIPALLSALEQPAFASLGERYRRAIAFAAGSDLNPEFALVLVASITKRSASPEHQEALRGLASSPEYARFEARFSGSFLKTIAEKLPSHAAPS